MTGSLALTLYLAASRLAGPLAGPLLRRRLVRGKEDATRLGERLGQPGLPRPDGPLIWMHGASVGEGMSMLPLIRALRAAGAGQILVTTGTVTSARRMAEVLPESVIHQFVPVDTASAVRAFLDHWRPDLGIWIESELWPRLVHETGQKGIPMAMVNARLSGGSARGWARAGAMARHLFGAFSLILTQDVPTVERIASLGGQAEFAGNLKALVSFPAADAEALTALRQVIGDRPVWLAASTHPGEEELALAAHRQVSEKTGAVLILAPRHPERGDTVAGLIADRGFALYRRSGGGLPLPEQGVYLADTLGDMGLWYRLAPVTLVGGSLADHGGHTPFEPVQAGSAVLTGPHVANFAEAYRVLGEAGAADSVTGAEDLARQVVAHLADPEMVRGKVARAEAAHAGLKPDVDGIAARLLALMRAKA